MRDSSEATVNLSTCADESESVRAKRSCRTLSEKFRETRAAILFAMILHTQATPAQSIISKPQKITPRTSCRTTTFSRIWLNIYGSKSSTSVPSTFIEIPAAMRARKGFRYFSIIFIFSHNTPVFLQLFSSVYNFITSYHILSTYTIAKFYLHFI